MHTEEEREGERGREGGRVKVRDSLLGHIPIWCPVFGVHNSDLQLIVGAGKIAQLVSAFFASMRT